VTGGVISRLPNFPCAHHERVDVQIRLAYVARPDRGLGSRLSRPLPPCLAEVFGPQK
jgi:hypothetical protein